MSKLVGSTTGHEDDQENQIRNQTRRNRPPPRAFGRPCVQRSGAYVGRGREIEATMKETEARLALALAILANVTTIRTA